MTSVSQVGTDRIIELQFSDGQYRLFLEFYAGGNIVLTDKELSILSLLRIVPEGPEQEELRVSLRYSLDNRQNFAGVPPLTLERVKMGLQRGLDRANEDTGATTKKPKKKTGDALRKALATSLNEFPPTLIDHALNVAGFESNIPVERVLENTAALEKIMLALQEAQTFIDLITSSDVCKGYIVAKPAQKVQTAIGEQDALAEKSDLDELRRRSLIYEDFHPFKPKQFETNPEITILEFDSFNKTIDEFFSSIESQKLASRLTEREENAKRKLETAKQDNEKRLGGLQQFQELNIRKAQSIEANLQRVQEAISAVNSLVAQSIGWPEIARLIEMEQQRGNVVAEMINLPLKLYENTVTLLLSEPEFDEDDFSGDETDSDVSDSEDEDSKAAQLSKEAKKRNKRLPVDVDLALSPWSNARQYYDQKKSAAVKEQKTLQASEKALKSTERKINADLKKGLKQEKDVMRPQRKAMWFEKFVYFISSEGYLVLGGKDSQQNEILYNRHLKKGDIYIHADLHGAASVIVKNRPGRFEDPIPPSTLSQAGILAVCTSNAWDSKAVMSAWWVHADQVSKTAPTGEYLQPGGFTVRGQKNFLPPAQLLLGFGLMFRISEESKTRHLKHRFNEEPPAETLEGEVTGAGTQDQGESGDEGYQTADEVDYTATGGADEQSGHDDTETHSIDFSNESSDQDGGDDDDDPRPGNPLQPNYGQQNMLLHLEERQSNAPTAIPDAGLRTTSSGHKSDVEREVQSLTAIRQGESERALQFGETQDIRHLSTEERKLVRKARPAATSEESTRPTTPATSTQLSNPSGQPDSKPQDPHVRGKHGKRNKMKTKYADQDEEDRALAMRLLGSSAAHEKATEDAVAKAAKEQELAAQKERRRKQHAAAMKRGREAEEIRRLDFDEGIDTLDERELNDICDLDAFVGAPLPGDEILDAFVMCGPWDALGGKCRWRVKIQPGTTKKGKAVKEILSKWVSVVTDREKRKKPSGRPGNEVEDEEEKVMKREAELIRAFREPEIVGVVPVGKVRVVMGPGEAGGKGRGGGSAGKGKRGGKGSKKQR